MSHASPFGQPGAAGTGAGAAGSALLPTIMAELRGEFYPLLSTLASCGSNISATYMLELYFSLIRVDAVLKRKERHLFVHTAQRHITRLLQQLHTVQHKRALLDENVKYVEELVGRCAALEQLCGSRDEEEEEDAAVVEEEDGDDEEEEETTLTIDISSSSSVDGHLDRHHPHHHNRNAEDVDEEDSDTNNDDDGGESCGKRSAHRLHHNAEAATTTASVSSVPRRRVTTSSQHSGRGLGHHYSSLSSTLSGVHRLRHFSFDEGLNEAEERLRVLRSASTLRDGSSNDGAEELATTATAVPPPSTARVATSTDTAILPSIAALTRPRHGQRPPPLPLSIVGTNMSQTTGASTITATTTASGSSPQSTSRRRHAGHSAHGTATRAADGATITASTTAGTNTETEVVAAAASTTGRDAAPSVVTGVQEALQRHFREKVQHTLTGRSVTLAGSVADITALSGPSGDHEGAAAGNSTGNFTAMNTALLSASEMSIPPSSRTPSPHRHLNPPSHHYSQQQQQQPSGNGGARGMLAPSPLTTTTTFSTSSSPCPTTGPSFDKGTAARAALANATTSVAPTDALPYATLRSPLLLGPVDTAHVWDRTFWGLLEGRTAAADLAVLLSLLNDGNRRLVAMGGAAATSLPPPSKACATVAAAGGGKSAMKSATTRASGGVAAGPQVSSSSHRTHQSSIDVGAPLIRSPPVPPLAPDGGARPLMNALKKTGSYTELQPMPLLQNLSIVSATGALGEEDNVAASSRKSGRAVDRVEPTSLVRPVPCPPSMTNGSSLGMDKHAAAAAAALSGGNSFLSDTAAGQPVYWAGIEDYARAEEARLHRDFWAHIPAILVTVAEGLMYGDEAQPTATMTDAGAATTGKEEPARLSAESQTGDRGTRSSGGEGGEEEKENDDQNGDDDGWGNATSANPTHGAADEQSPRRRRTDPHSVSPTADAAQAPQENVLVPLHPPCAEALQLLPTFSPVLRNYRVAMQKLVQDAAEYAKSTQVYHARALAVVAAQQQQQQFVALATPHTADTPVTSGFASENEGGAANSADGGRQQRLTRAATQRSSVTDLQELGDGVGANGERRVPASLTGGNPLLLPVVSDGKEAVVNTPEAATLGLLGEGSATEVRPVDVVMYAMVTAVYVQCAMAVEQQHAQQRLQHQHQLQPQQQCEVGVHHQPTVSGARSTQECGEEDSETSPSTTTIAVSTMGEAQVAANASLANNNGGEQSSFYGSTSFGGAPSHYGGVPSTIRLHPLLVLSGSRGDTVPGVNTSFTTAQLQQSFPFNALYSPTEAALSLLRRAHDARANGNDGATVDADEPMLAAEGDGAPAASLCGSTATAPLMMQLHMQEVLSSANAFSWVSLPSLMRAELQHLRVSLHTTRVSVQRMECQVRGELALLLFRLLSMVLDWLMPAVYVADPRIWIFYRKWCCDLYRVLCTDLELLTEFRRLLNQSGVAVVPVAGGSAAEANTAMPRSYGGTSSSGATNPLTTPTQPRPMQRGNSAVRHTPPIPGTPMGTPQLTPVSMYSPVWHTNASTEGGACATNTTTSSSYLEDAFGCISPGVSLRISVQHHEPPVLPGVQLLLAEEEAHSRVEARGDAAALHVAHALLRDEDKVVPLHRPFLVTRLVAATLRGIDADIAESLLWVAGEATARLPDASGDEESARDARSNTSTGAGLPLSAGAGGRTASTSAREQRGSVHLESDRGSPSGQRAAMDDSHVHSTARWKSHRPRHGSRSASAPRSSIRGSHSNAHRPGHRAADAGGGMGGGAPSSRHDVASSEEDWEDERERAGGGQQPRNRRHTAKAKSPPAPVQSPVMSLPPGSPASASATTMAGTSGLMFPSNGSSGANAASGSHISTGFPHPSPHSPHIEGPVTRAASPPPPSFPGMEGPMLVHHHRFRYPSVSGFDDVARLYRSTLEDAELILSPHDPVYAALLLSTADLYLHDLHDRDTAATLVDDYLADVSEEQIQAPVWEALPAGLAGLDAVGTTNLARTGTAPNRGFSVTRARQAATAISPSTTTPPMAPPPIQQQQPCVPMVIPSWNNEADKENFLGILRVLRQIQVYLTREV